MKYINKFQCYLKKKTLILVQIAFPIDAAIPFQKFLATFQFEGSLIQIFFKELKVC